MRIRPLSTPTSRRAVSWKNLRYLYVVKVHVTLANIGRNTLYTSAQRALLDTIKAYAIMTA